MIDRFDHIVLTVASLERTLAFYVDGLGMREEKADGRTALLFGRRKINLHEAAAAPILPRAEHPRPGSADVCLIADRPIEGVVAVLRDRGIGIELGSAARSGATSPMRSVYLRDPDGNLVDSAATKLQRHRKTGKVAFTAGAVAGRTAQRPVQRKAALH